SFDGRTFGRSSFYPMSCKKLPIPFGPSNGFKILRWTCCTSTGPSEGLSSCASEPVHMPQTANRGKPSHASNRAELTMSEFPVNLLWLQCRQKKNHAPSCSSPGADFHVSRSGDVFLPFPY